MTKSLFIALAFVLALSVGGMASDTAQAEAKLDTKAGLLDREWRIVKLAPLRSLMLPKQLRFGLPPVEQQVFDAQALPASLVESLNPPPPAVVIVPVQVPVPTPVLSNVVPTSGPTCTTITTPNGTFTTCTP